MSEATMSPKSTEVITEVVDRSIDEEIADLPFTFDLSAKNDFLKITRDKLPLMKEKGWEWLTTDRGINYRTNWDTWFGLREFVQNALDEAESVEITYNAIKDTTYVKDNGKGFLAKHLLLGQHKGLTEEEKHTSRGCFGEGMKLAALPFFRAGCKVFIRTVGLDIAFAMGPFDEHYVHYTFKRKNNHKQGTHIAITAFNGTQFKEKFTPFIPKEQILLNMKGGPRRYDKNKVRAVYDRPGDLYVRDIFVQNVNRGWENAYFDYNLWFDYNQGVLDPDRTFVKHSEYIADEFNYIIGSKDVEFLTKFFRKISEPDEKLKISEPRYSWEHKHIHGNSLTLNEEQAKAVHKAIQNVFGKKEYTWSGGYDEAKALEHLGVLDLTYKLPNLSRPLHDWKLIKSAKEWVMLGDLKHTCEVTEKMITDQYGEVAGKALTVAQSILTDIMKTYSAYSGTVVFFWSIKPSREVDKVGGYYTHSKRKISIKITQLRALHYMLECFIHELGHAVSNGAEDLSEPFEQGLMQAGFFVSEYFNRHPEAYGKLMSSIKDLKDINWGEFKIDLAKAEMTVGEKSLEQVKKEMNQR